MKKFGTIILLALGFTAFMASCNCKTCSKSGENSVQLCRDNYNSDDDYNSAQGVYQLNGYECK